MNGMITTLIGHGSLVKTIKPQVTIYETHVHGKKSKHFVAVEAHGRIYIRHLAEKK